MKHCRLMIAVLAILAAGCQIPGRRGPVPRALATCRQLSQRGIAAAERGRPQRARELLADAVEACPVDPEARRHYADALWKCGARTEAITQQQEAARLASEDAMLHVRLAEMHLATGKMDLARRRAEQALDLNPRLPAAWVIRGRVMRADGKLQQALADFHRALGYAPDDRQVLLEIAELYRQLDQPQRALSCLHSLADTYSPGEQPQNVLFLTGLAHMALQRYEDAAESFSAAVLRDTPTTEIFYRLAEAELAAGRPAEAATAAQQALLLTPGDPASSELLRRLETARSSEGSLHR